MLFYYPVIDFDRTKRAAAEGEDGDHDDNNVDDDYSDVIQFDVDRPADEEAVVIVCELKALRNMKHDPQGRKVLAILGCIIGSTKKAAEVLQNRVFMPSSTFTSTDGGRFTSILHCPPVSAKVPKRSRAIECVYTSAMISEPQVDVLRVGPKRKLTKAGKDKGAAAATAGTRRAVFVAVDEAPAAKVAELIRHRASSPNTKYNILYIRSEKHGYMSKKCLFLVKSMDGVKVKRIKML